MAKTKEKIIEIYKNIYEKHKKTPTFKMCEEAGIEEYELYSNFAGLTELAIICGVSPNRFGNEKSDLNEILKQYGILTRTLKKKPVQNDWVRLRVKPTKDALKSHGRKWSDLQSLFVEFAHCTEEWSDIIHFFPQTPQVNNTMAGTTSSLPKHEISDDIKNHIPPYYHDLIDLSINDTTGKKFEDKINFLFQMLGFKVEAWGQGTGRNPDGIALQKRDHYAIMIDSKVRRDGYSIGTEDRKFIGYIEDHKRRLEENEGMNNIYFLIVSSKFNTMTEIAINKITEATQKPISLITAEQLLKILAFKIKKPTDFDFIEFKKLFINPGQISDIKINKFIKPS